ncbi:unnamed protein product [Staurois parvus]|uniref:Uncharacterized protein n=1 Tax=Staurois parvus TaxID=386267 RepID=A0ABN9FGC7_9NEOB|nr:unnamed protein product [Staurois parvus]
MEVSGGIGREGWRALSGDQWRDWQEGWRTLIGGQWRDWQRGVGDTEWRPVEGSGGIGREGWRTLNGGQWRDWQRGVEDTERSYGGIAERGGGH